jgi:septum site-determining protein MinC
MVELEEKISIKGTSDGLLISFLPATWKEMEVLLFDKIEANGSFFEKAKVSLAVGEARIKAAEMGRLRDRLSQKNITLRAVISTSDVTINSSQMLGIHTQIGLKKTNMRTTEKASLDGDAAVWIERTLRAGYRVETKCHVIVMGDVNPGAEIISGGNVFIWGKANGSIHAGAEGNKAARVFAIEMKPTHLKIADVTAEPFAGKIKNQSEFAYIEGNQIAIKSWASRNQI